MPTRDLGVRPPSGRLADIEGMRALAASSILVFHTWICSGRSGSFDVGPVDRLFPHLAFGVTLFFTLSGFLMYGRF